MLLGWVSPKADPEARAWGHVVFAFGLWMRKGGSTEVNWFYEMTEPQRARQDWRLSCRMGLIPSPCSVITYSTDHLSESPNQLSNTTLRQPISHEGSWGTELGERRRAQGQRSLHEGIITEYSSGRLPRGGVSRRTVTGSQVKTLHRRLVAEPWPRKQEGASSEQVKARADALGNVLYASTELPHSLKTLLGNCYDQTCCSLFEVTAASRLAF